MEVHKKSAVEEIVGVLDTFSRNLLNFSLVCRYSNVPALKCVGIQVCHYSSVPAFKRTVFKCVGIQVCRYSSVPIFTVGVSPSYPLLGKHFGFSDRVPFFRDSFRPGTNGFSDRVPRFLTERV